MHATHRMQSPGCASPLMLVCALWRGQTRVQHRMRARDVDLASVLSLNTCSLGESAGSRRSCSVACMIKSQ